MLKHDIHDNDPEKYSRSSLRWLAIRIFLWEKFLSIAPAKRLGLRDKGIVVKHSGCVVRHQNFSGNFSLEFKELNDYCPAYLRLGKKGERTVIWCRKCESIVAQNPSGNPDDDFLESLHISNY